MGYVPDVVVTGLDVMDSLSRKKYNLIFMDVQMPEMDGFEATAAIRKREAETGRHTPIIAMTAHALKGDRERCLEAGMDDYLTKPVRVEELVDALERSSARKAR